MSNRLTEVYVSPKSSLLYYNRRALDKRRNLIILFADCNKLKVLEFEKFLYLGFRRMNTDKNIC